LLLYGYLHLDITMVVAGFPVDCTRNVGVALFRMPATWLPSSTWSGGLSSTCLLAHSLPYGIICCSILHGESFELGNGIIETLCDVNKPTTEPSHQRRVDMADLILHQSWCIHR
jgi:hypothetical protein